MRVGLSSVDFTPQPGLPLMGNYRDDYAARGVHDSLWARGLVFADDRDTKAGLLAVDVCMLDRHNVALMREVIGSQCDVPPQNVLIHATHTHSAPAATGKIGMADEVAPHAGEIEAFLRKAASAVAEASRDLQPAILEIGHAQEDGAAFNRRLRRRDGTTQMNWEALQPGFDPTGVVSAWGSIDPELICLTARRGEKAIAALVNFGLHPAILAGDNWLYSADYPGYLIAALSGSYAPIREPVTRPAAAEGAGPGVLCREKNGGEGIRCLFLNGCCGDVNHVDYRDPSQGRGFPMAQRVGTALATRAREAIDAAVPMAADCVRVSREQVRLDRLRIDAQERQWCEHVLREARERPPQGQVDGLPDAYFAQLRLEMSQVQEQPDDVEVMAIRIGDLVIVGLPGEAFCQLGMEIKRRSPARHTLVAGLCNDAIGYLPTREAFPQGGYETTVGSTFYEPGSGERLVESAIAQVERLFVPEGCKRPSGT